MADKPFKAFEREIARLLGGSRFWSNSGQAIDVEGPLWVGQCKLVQRLSLSELTALVETADRQAKAKPGKLGVVAVKLRRGRGKASPTLLVVSAPTWVEMNGYAVTPISFFESGLEASTAGGVQATLTSPAVDNSVRNAGKPSGAPHAGRRPYQAVPAAPAQPPVDP